MEACYGSFRTTRVDGTRETGVAILLLKGFKERVRILKTETFSLYLASRHPGTPWYAKVFIAAVVAYALSPIDLIPDFVPVLGYLDDLVLIPAGIAVALKMVPPHVLKECRVRAREVMLEGRPKSRAAAVVIILIWIAMAAAFALWLHSL